MERIKEQFLISPFLVFFLINSMQIGIGILGFQRIIAKSAGYDSWIAIIIVGIAVHIILWMIYRILEESNGDLVEVHKEVYGKWIGGLISVVFCIYLVTMSITVLRSFIEVVQVWMFPEFNKWIFSIYMLLLIYYIIAGGFRTVTGISFFSVILPSYIILLIVYPLESAHIRNLLPVMTHSLKDIVSATKHMSLSIIGFEVILIYYPFIKDPQKSKKWAHLGAFMTTILYLVVCLTAFVFFSEKQLDKQIWATLAMFKSVVMPFVERFEYIGITTWLLVILPNLCLTLWASSRGIKRVFAVRQKKALIGIMIIVFIITGLFRTRQSIGLLNDYMSTFGFYFIFFYIPILFVLTLIIRKLRDKK
ncbi:GerAB/ArcD/ProY family transporter [Ferdinandcohnia quinoae]|uniref:Spore germination protein n=1 Tax=Fredinandcohnia quinoae TaxID=2918902 RepID=A0AAW5E214_9BACI|nr:GerAB/ArcD/ProY family transporter [Fredinandcohnia sp. SECRCQ15]MCH1625589.1 spore germination protein [Fredinandcohnia sp. SECRCQ15]